MELLTIQAARRNRPVAGGLLVLTSALLFAGVGAIVKVAAAGLPIEVVVFFRNAMAMVFFLPWLMTRQRDLSLKTDCFHLHLLGWLIWGETLDGMTLAGAVLTCSAGIIATYHSERHIKP